MATPSPMQGIDDAVLVELIELLAQRDIAGGREVLGGRHEDQEENRLAQYTRWIGEVRREMPYGALFLSIVTMWCDVDPAYLPPLRQALEANYPPSGDASLTFRDGIAIRLARGLVAMYEQKLREATSNLEVVFRAAEVLPFPDCGIVAAYGLSRCYRDLGKYDYARCWCEEALTLSRRQPNREKQQAVINLMKAWLLFQVADTGEKTVAWPGEQVKDAKQITDEALALLAKSVKEIKATNDYVTIGNMYSMKARRWRRRGHYQDASDLYRIDALPNFDRALKEFGIVHPQHKRALANAAFCARLVALRETVNSTQPRLSREKSAFLDALANEYRPVAATNSQLAAELKSIIRRRVNQLYNLSGSIVESKELVERERRRSREWLERAEELEVSNKRTKGIISIYSAYLEIDIAQSLPWGKEAKECLDRTCGAAQSALSEAEAGEQNHLLRARALVVLCLVEYQLFDRSSKAGEPETHLQLAENHARAALKAAESAGHPGVIAKAQTWLGIVLACWGVSKPGARNEALELCGAAGAILERASRGDYLWDDLLLLRRTLYDKGTGAQELRSWIAGAKHLTMEELRRYAAKMVYERLDKDVGGTSAELDLGEPIVRRLLDLPPRSRRNTEKEEPEAASDS